MLIEIISITSIWCLGLTIASQPDMVFESWQAWAEDKRYAKPLVSCIWCMPSVHSLIGYLFAYGIGIISGFSWGLLVMYPLVVCGASILNGTVWSVIQLLLKKIEYYDNMPKDDPNFEEDLDMKEPNESYFKRS